MKAIQITGFGEPESVLELVELPEPNTPDSDQALIQMHYSPINHSDLLIIRGMFGLKPVLPFIAGAEGVGTVLSVGKKVTHIKPGDQVTVPFGIGAWTERVTIGAEKLYLVSPSFDPRQASMLLVNPPTAVLLLNEFVQLEKGSWVVYNAANSSVARSIVAIARSKGIRTLGIVRNQQALAAALDSGADRVLVDSEDIVNQAQGATDGANIQLALDAVGGEATNTLVKIAGFDSHIVIYALESGERAIIDQADLIIKRMKVHGFNMFYPQFLSRLSGAMDESAALFTSGKLSVPISGVYPLSAYKEAVAHTERGGKVLFSIGE